MQRAEGPSSRLVPEPSPTRPSLSPPVAFLLLAVVIGALGAIFYLTRPDTPVTPTNPNAAQQQPDFSLTNEEAITRFEELQIMVQEAYANHDVTLLSSVYASDSPIGAIAARELRRLARDGVFDLTAFDTKSVEIVGHDAREIRLEEIVVVTPRFEDKQGNNVTSESKVVRQTVEWMLHLENGQWLLYDALVTDASVIR